MSRLNIALAILLVFGYGRLLQAQVDVGLDTPHTFSVHGRASDVARQLGSGARRPIGLFGSDWNEDCPAAVSIRAGSLRQALEMLAAQCPALSWRQIGKSIVFQGDWSVISPLGVMVEAYSVHQVDWREAIRQALNLPEVEDWLNENNAHAPKEFAISTPYHPKVHGQEPRGIVKSKEPMFVSLNERRIRFADLLDEITKSAGYSAWDFNLVGERLQVMISIE